MHVTDLAAAFLLRLMGQVIHKTKVLTTTKSRPDFSGQKANDYIRQRLQTAKGGIMISKFGTYELKAFINFYARQIGLRKTDVSHILHYDYVLYHNMNHTMRRLCDNAGFFPNDVTLGTRYAKLVAEDWQQVDILASYQKEEAYPYSLHTNSSIVRVDLEGFYAPFLWKNPWTNFLRDKRVLIIHPFTDSIRRQYEHREDLFRDPDVLPPFKELLTLKAVQSIAGNQTEYSNWFEALEDMEHKMDEMEYDVALIGCGAYGMHLAAHAKRQGKIGIHLASMVQLLFGIYGHRWENDETYRPFILPSWIRPDSSERPQGAEQVENGCYW